jgi:hypothetical protein
MTLKAKLPSLAKGSANLGEQLRELLAVVVELCDAVERLEEAAPADQPETPAEETASEDKQEAPEAASDEPVEEKAPAATKPASKPATRASAK